MIDAVAAVFLVQVQNRLGIAAVLEFVAAGLKFLAIVGMVIDLAVIDDHQVRAEHRLNAVPRIDNCEPPVAETDISLDKHTSIIRPAMMQNITHRRDF